ncbi:MAG: CarD family transcriptional regulator [Deltaproteobacteria bacterium]|nr:MAG: CarD family transcriptional regulator [Deltaproteobacteria bacterium]RLA96744.1 MAG: CarD family transcriptional regulator [Deltaproteobacteria bacterium]
MFEVGEFVVYPGHGVVTIEDIQTMEIGGKVQKVYVLRVLDTQMTIMVPVDNAQMVGMREIIDSSKIPEIYEFLKRKEKIGRNSHQPWNQRYRQYMERIKSGSIFEVAKVLKELHLLKSEKGLSFGEKKLLDTAQKLLVQELAVSKRVEEKEIRKELLDNLP